MPTTDRMLRESARVDPLNEFAGQGNVGQAEAMLEEVERLGDEEGAEATPRLEP